VLVGAVIILGIADGLASQASVGSVPRSDHLVTARAMGPVVVGMTLEEARRNLPSATFRRTSDGDGAALVEVVFRPGESLTLWAGEDDPDLPIDWARPIRTIEAFDPAFSTAEGIRVGLPLVLAERIWGPVREIVESEIEGRQFVTFARQPAAFDIRIDYSGVFAPGTRQTTRYRPDAKIMSIAISSE